MTISGITVLFAPYLKKTYFILLVHNGTVSVFVSTRIGMYELNLIVSIAVPYQNEPGYLCRLVKMPSAKDLKISKTDPAYQLEFQCYDIDRSQETEVRSRNPE